MGMFETLGRSAAVSIRKENTLRKRERLNRALRHEEPDRVPISDFFWGSFTRRWRQELGLPDDANPYEYYDLDWIVTVPNMDPWIRPFETLRETAERGRRQDRLRRRHAQAVRLAHARDAWLGNRLAREAGARRVRRSRATAAASSRAATTRSPASATASSATHRPGSTRSSRSGRTFPVYGSMIEVSECLTRLIGQENAMLWMGEYPDRMGAVINRIGAHYLECARAEIDAGSGPARRLRHLGRRGLQEEHLHVAVLLARVLQALGERHDRVRSRPRPARDLPRLRQRQGDPPRLHRDRHRRLQSARGQGGPGRRRSPPAVRAQARRSAATATSRSGNPATATRSAARSSASSMPRRAAVTSSSPTIRSPARSSGRTYDEIVKLVREFGRYPIQLGEFDEVV